MDCYSPCFERALDHKKLDAQKSCSSSRLLGVRSTDPWPKLWKTMSGDTLFSAENYAQRRHGYEALLDMALAYLKQEGSSGYLRRLAAKSRLTAS